MISFLLLLFDGFLPISKPVNNSLQLGLLKIIVSAFLDKLYKSIFMSAQQAETISC